MLSSEKRVTTAWKTRYDSFMNEYAILFKLHKDLLKQNQQSLHITEEEMMKQELLEVMKR